MSRFFRFIRIAWRMSKQIPWVGEPEWGVTESNALRKFLVTFEGKRFRMILLNMVLKQNQQAVSSKKELEFEAGFANGVRTTVHTVEALGKSRNRKNLRLICWGLIIRRVKTPQQRPVI